jgi:peroxiredoxin
MKKNILYIIIVVILFNSCLQSKKTVIEGTVNHAESVAVSLVDMNDIRYILVDTSTIKGNNLNINTYINNSGLYCLNFGEKGEKGIIYLYLESGDHITINMADMNNPMDYTLSGNDESQAIAKLIQYVGNSSIKEKIVHDNIDTLEIRNEVKDSLRIAFINRNNSDYVRFLKNFIAEQKNPVIAAFAINFFGDYNTQQEMPYIMETVDALAKKAPKSPYIKQFSDALQSYKDAILQEEQGGLPIGSKAPNITLPNWNGDTLSLKNLQGKYVLLDFWASWCPPCRAENPNVVAQYQKYKDKGFDVFSVSLDNGTKMWKNAIEKDGLVWKNHVSDLKGWHSSVVQLYAVESIPTTYLLDKTGKIIAKNLRGKALEYKLMELFPAEKDSAWAVGH